MTSTVERAIRALGQGELVIVYDDLNTQMSSLIGAADQVSPHHINEMIKIGKGLVSVCLSETRAKSMNLPLMVSGSQHPKARPFAISVDYKTTTTGISAFDRSETIQALTDDRLQLDDFRTPGHVFPLIGKDNGLLDRVDMVEAALDLVKWSSPVHVAYSCELLDASGELPERAEVELFAHSTCRVLLYLSDMIEIRKKDRIGTLSGRFVHEDVPHQKMGGTMGRLHTGMTVNCLDKGVYGVYVSLGQEDIPGVMMVESGCDIYIHLLDLEQRVFDQMVSVEVKFQVRGELPFTFPDQWSEQFCRDADQVAKRFEWRYPKSRQEVGMLMMNKAIHYADLAFSKYCEQVYGINRGVYNTIDATFFDQGITHVVTRRNTIIAFLDFLTTTNPQPKARYKVGHRGLSPKLHEFWIERMRNSDIEKKAVY